MGSRRSGTPRQPIRDAKPTLGHRQQHHAAIRGQASAVESSGDFLGVNAGNENGRRLSSVMASGAFAVKAMGLA